MRPCPVQGEVCLPLVLVDVHTSDAPWMPRLGVAYKQLLEFSPRQLHHPCTSSYIVNTCFPNCCHHGKQIGDVEGALRLGNPRGPGTVLQHSLVCKQRVTASETRVAAVLHSGGLDQCQD